MAPKDTTSSKSGPPAVTAAVIDALGLARLAERYPAELAQALANAAALGRSVAKDIHWTEEPVHCFSLVDRAGTAPEDGKRP